MINCILIQNSEINEVKVKNLSEDIIYKKCNFKNDSDFSKIKIWNHEDYIIELWGKSKGFSNSLSIFKLFKNNNLHIYGKSIFIMKSNENKYVSLNKDNFINFFNLDIIDTIDKEIVKLKDDNEIVNIKELQTKDQDETDINSEYSYNSELTYELYEYSDDESL